MIVGINSSTIGMKTALFEEGKGLLLFDVEKDIIVAL